MKIKLFMILTMAALAWPGASFADWGHHDGGWHGYYHYHDRPHWGVRVANFYPHDYVQIYAGGVPYYYSDGIYYGYAGGNYVVVAPPVGAMVTAIPSDFHAVILHGMTYYTDNGVYYVYTPSGYRVVATPR